MFSILLFFYGLFWLCSKMLLLLVRFNFNTRQTTTVAGRLV